jgi:hypothetical protein
VPRIGLARASVTCTGSDIPSEEGARPGIFDSPRKSAALSAADISAARGNGARPGTTDRSPASAAAEAMTTSIGICLEYDGGEPTPAKPASAA